MVSGRKKVLVFILLAFGFSWTLAGVYYLKGGRLSDPGALPILIAYMFGPMLGAIIVQKWIAKKGVIKELSVSFRLNRWFALAWILPVLLAFAALGVSLLFPGVSYTADMAGFFERYASTLSPEEMQQMKDSVAALPVHPLWIAVLQGMLAGATVNAVAALGEELGWRSFLQKEWAWMGFWPSSLCIGAIWGLWHLPIILQGHNYPQHPEIGSLLMILWCMLLAPIFAFVAIKARSVIAAALIHGTLNGTAGIPLLMIEGGSDLTTGLLGLPGMLVLLLCNLFIYIYWKNGRLEEDLTSYAAAGASKGGV